MNERLSERESIIKELSNISRGVIRFSDECLLSFDVDKLADWHLAEVKPLVKALKSLIDDDECSLDHHGYCQTHFSGSSPCVMDMARKALKRANGGE